MAHERGPEVPDTGNGPVDVGWGDGEGVRSTRDTVQPPPEDHVSPVVSERRKGLLKVQPEDTRVSLIGKEDAGGRWVRREDKVSNIVAPLVEVGQLTARHVNKKRLWPRDTKVTQEV